MSGIECRLEIDNVSKSEAENYFISINVFSCEEDNDNIDIYPIRITKFRERTEHVNLLLLSDNQGQKTLLSYHQQE